jgi:hypothetical protein
MTEAEPVSETVCCYFYKRLCLCAIVCLCVFYIGILAPLACCGLWVAVSLIATWVFPRLLVFQGCMWVCMCLGLYAILVFPRFYELWSVQWLGHLLPPVSDLLQGLMCVCAQVSCSVVSNWPLCDFLWTCVLWYFVYIFNSSILFVLETPDDG